MTQSPEQPSTPPQQKKGSAGKFMLGLIAGCALSAIVWIMGWNLIQNIGLFVVAGMLVVKVGVAAALLRSPQVKAAGVGVLVSIAVGALIFFGTCANHVEL